MLAEKIDPPAVDAQHVQRRVPGLLGDLQQRCIRLDDAGDIAGPQAVTTELYRVEARLSAMSLEDQRHAMPGQALGLPQGRGSVERAVLAALDAAGEPCSVFELACAVYRYPQTELDRAARVTSTGAREKVGTLARLIGLLGIDVDSMADLSQMVQFFDVARNCVVHRSGRASKQLTELAHGAVGRPAPAHRPHLFSRDEP
jgi:hypothetical protein